MGATAFRVELNYNTPITAKELNIVFNGVTYENVPRIEDADKGEIYYGSATFSEYPFELLVESNLDGIWLYTNTRGEHTISASIPSTETVTTTPCFDKARGYSCTETTTLLADESVTTAQEAGAPEGLYRGTLAYSIPIDADTIKVTFNSTEYTCDKILMGKTVAYGGVGEQEPDFSKYPFAIMSSSASDVNVIYTETAGTYQIKIEAFDETVETSECFKKAVKAVAGTTEPLIVDVLTSSSPWQVSQNMPWQVIHDEYVKGRTILFQEVTPGTPAFKKKDKFGSVVSVSSNVQDGLESKYYIDVYVQGQLRRFFASAPDRGVTYNSVS